MVKYFGQGPMKANSLSKISSARRRKTVVPGPRERRELAVQVATIKNGLIREFGVALGGHGNLLKSALNEAEAIAWQTPYPHLVFPVLAQEKASAVNNWAARQRNVTRASREIALTE
jgi:hypothetical protein